MKKITFFFAFFLLANISRAQTVGLYEVDITSSQPSWTINGGGTITINRTLANCLPNFGANCNDENWVNYGLEVVLDNGTDQYELLPITFNYIEGVNCPTTQAWFQPSTTSLDMMVPCNVPSGNYVLKVICHGVFSIMTQQTSSTVPSTVHIKADGTTLINAVSSGLVVSADIATVSVTNSTYYVSDITFTTTNATCSDLSNGSATANIVVSGIGGPGTYSYAWSNGQTGQTITNLSSGTYNVTVTDNNSGCPVRSTDFNNSAIVGNDYEVDVALSTIHICGGSSGQINATASSGVAPYNYSWTTGQTGSNIVVSSAGSYGVNVEDANGCTATADVDIIEATSPTVNLPEEIKTCDQLYELCGLAVEDPQGNYEYQWSVVDPNTQTTQLVTTNPCFYPLLTVWGHAQYTVKVTNEYGCSTVRTINVRPAKGCGSLNEGRGLGMITTVHPNPVGTGESFKVTMDSDSETATLEIIDIKTGKIVYTSELSNDQPVEHVISDFKSDNSPAVYFIKVYNETGVAIERLVVK